MPMCADARSTIMETTKYLIRVVAEERISSLRLTCSDAGGQQVECVMECLPSNLRAPRRREAGGLKGLV